MRNINSYKKWRTHHRIEKDKAVRSAKQKHREQYDSLYQFSYYRKALLACFRGVRFKHSVQLCMANPITYAYNHIRKFRKGNFKVPLNESRVAIYERGKRRDIVPIRIYQRDYEHVLNDNILLPIFAPRLIANNGASLKGKGTTYTRNRMNKDLWRAVQRYGPDFYIVQFDFKSYFENVSHRTAYDILRRYVKDKNTLTLAMNTILSYRRSSIELQLKSGEITQEEHRKAIDDLRHLRLRGISLGSQTSQILALIVPNALDHYIKDTLRVKFYTRYMDDGVLFLPTKEIARETLRRIKVKADSLGLILNEKKSHIIKASRGFTFLKVRYYVTRGGKIVKKLYRKGIIRMRRKLNKFAVMVEDGKMTVKDVSQSVQSWFSHSFVANGYHARKEIAGKYKGLFGVSGVGRRKNKRCLAAYL